MGTLFGLQIVLLMRKKMVKENSQGAKVDNFKFWIHAVINQKTQKKKNIGTLYLFHQFFFFSFYIV